MNTSTMKLSTDVDGQRARLPPRAAVSIYHRDGTTVLTLAPDESCVVGRSTPADVVIPEPSLSRQHVRFSFDGETVRLVDLESTNGTTVLGVKVTPGVAIAVGPGDELVIGAVVATVSLLGRGDARPGGLDGHEAFAQALKEELRRARHFQRPVSVLSIASRDEDLHVSTFADDVRRHLRPVDRVALYAPRVLEVLLPEQALAEARVVAGAVAAKHPSLVVGVAGSGGGEYSVERLIGAAHKARKDARGAPSRVGVAPEETGPREGARGPDDTAPVVENPAMRTLFSTIDRVAGKADRVLIHGETGSGKELVAQALHARGARAERPFLSVNCGALPPTLLESTLFGHVKGAFTGADKDKKGIFESGDGGTVFLDEIGELPPAAQAALLRVLESRKVTRLGATDKEIPVDVCIVTATHRDLEDMCREGTFRTDLWYRLNLLTLKVPPLRQRRDEVEALAMTFLRRADPTARFTGFSREAVAALQAWDWPGNVRELKNVVERAVLLATGGEIGLDDLDDRLRQVARRVAMAPAVPVATVATGDYRSQVRAAEATVLLAALARCDGVQTAAARELDMPIRTFVHRLKTLGIRRRDDGSYVLEEG